MMKETIYRVHSLTYPHILTHDCFITSNNQSKGKFNLNYFKRNEQEWRTHIRLQLLKVIPRNFFRTAKGYEKMFVCRYQIISKEFPNASRPKQNKIFIYFIYSILRH